MGVHLLPELQDGARLAQSGGEGEAGGGLVGERDERAALGLVAAAPVAGAVLTAARLGGVEWGEDVGCPKPVGIPAAWMRVRRVPASVRSHRVGSWASL
jgi:hypothetical protein